MIFSFELWRPAVRAFLRICQQLRAIMLLNAPDHLINEKTFFYNWFLGGKIWYLVLNYEGEQWEVSSKSFSKNVSIAAEGGRQQGREQSSKKQRSPACPNISPETDNVQRKQFKRLIKLVFNLFASSQGWVMNPKKNINFGTFQAIIGNDKVIFNYNLEIT